MYLNDACDAAFDRQHRRERPIPSGAVSLGYVWRTGGSLILLGWMGLFGLGLTTGWLGTGLALAIILYDWIHKAVSFSPILMALCRFFLFLASASVGVQGVTGLAVWTALALSGWIIGLSYVARRESTKNPLRRWPLAALGLPFLLAALANAGETRTRAWIIALLLGVWASWCLRHLLVEANRNLGLTVTGLLAGICLVDWLAVVPPTAEGWAFPGLFLASLAAQRLIPAT